MAIDMAGYDIIVQMKSETVADAASMPFENIPGKTAFLLGGPFLFAAALPSIDGFNGGMFHATGEVQLQPRRGDTNLVRLAVSVRDGLIAGSDFPGALTDLDCSAQMSLPLNLGYVAGLQSDGTWPPDKEQSEAAGTTFPPEYATGLVIDPSAATIAARLGPNVRKNLIDATSEAFAAAVESALSQALTELLNSAAHISVPLGFGALRVRPGVASTEFDLLADWPVMRWISPSTLAIFAHYGLTLAQRDPSRKDGRSDIDTRPLKFVYPGAPAGMSAIPAPCAAVSISTEAIRRLGFCPSIREHVARESVIQQKTKEFENALKNRNRDYTPTEQKAYYDTLVTEAKTKSTKEAMELALLAAARAGATEWTGSSEAASALTAATPPDCGRGEAQFPIDVPAWFDGKLTVTQVSLTPEAGRIVTRLKAEARIPPGAGADATATIVTRLSIDQGGQRIIATHDDPQVTTDAAGAAIVGVLVGFLTAPFAGLGWGVILGATTAILLEEGVSRFGPGLVLSQAGSFMGELPPGQSVPLPSQPLARLDEVVTGASGLTIYGLVGRTMNWNDTRLRIDLRVKRIARSLDPEVPAEHGVYRKEVSCQDGLPREFSYTTSGWRETWHVWVETSNIPGPLSFENVTIGLGDESVRFIQDGLLQPLWREPVPLIIPETVVAGPATVFESPAGARVVENVRIAVAEIGPGQWEIRTRGADGCYGLRISATCIDARETRHGLQTFCFPDGLVLDWDDAMDEESRACIAKLKHELERLPPIAEMEAIPPWAEVWDPVPWVERGRIQRALLAKDRVTLEKFDQHAVQREIELGQSLLSGKLGTGRLR